MATNNLIALAVQWSVKYFFAPNYPIFRKKCDREAEEEGARAITKRYTFHANAMNPKKLKTPWLSKELKKFSKTKQRLYIKFLKNKSSESEEKYKNYRNLFEKLKRKSKKNYYASLLIKGPYIFAGVMNYFKHILMGHEIFLKIFDEPQNSFFMFFHNFNF